MNETIEDIKKHYAHTLKTLRKNLSNGWESAIHEVIARKIDTALNTIESFEQAAPAFVGWSDENLAMLWKERYAVEPFNIKMSNVVGMIDENPTEESTWTAIAVRLIHNGYLIKDEDCNFRLKNEYR